MKKEDNQEIKNSSKFIWIVWKNLNLVFYKINILLDFIYSAVKF
jgi:hypothetical protein